MKKDNLTVIAILAASAVLFTAGLVKKYANKTPSDAGKQFTIAVIPKGTANMWWAVVRDGALAAGKEEGAKILWNGPEQETDRERQIQTVEDALIQRVDAIVLGPNDFQALARSVDHIADSKTPCIIIDSPVNNTRYDAIVATDNLAGGAAAAEALATAMGGKGNVLLIRYVQNSASTDQRAEGFLKIMKEKYPGIKILADEYTLGSVEDARNRTVDLLTRHKNVDGIFAVNQPSAIGAYKALQTQKLTARVKYVGFDSDPVLLEGIERGEVHALVVQNPYDIGYLGVKEAVKKLRGLPVQKNTPVASMLVNKDNLAEMKKKFPAALGL